MYAEIKTIFKKQNKTIVTYTPDDMTPANIKLQTALNTHYYAFICTREHESGVYIDLSTIFQEQLAGQANDWSTFYNKLTPVIVDSYTITGAGLTSDGSVEFHQATIVHPMTTVGLDIAYCDKKDTTEFNKYYKRFDMPDLAIRKTDEYKKDLEDLHLENSIVSVNGFICNTTYFKDVLYVAEGAKNLWSISKNIYPNISMIDTTPLGELIKLPLSKCKIEYMYGKGTNIHDNSIKLSLPDQYNFQEHTPLLSIAGKLYFPDELTLPNNNTIILKPFMFNLATVLLAMQDTQANYITDTDMLDSIDTPVEYLAQLGKTDRSDIYDVIYLIHNNHINIQRDKVTKDLYWLTKFNTNRSGILLRMSDRTIMDYTTLEYDFYNLRHGVVYPNNIMRISTDNDTNRQIGIRDIRCNHTNPYFRWTRDARYEMIYLTC